jgi:hypothetical protein
VPINNLQDFLKNPNVIKQWKNNLISKFETIWTNLSPNMNPFTQNNPYPFYSLTKLNFFITLEMLNGMLQNLF